jgi:ADP-ribose pyrophosphatase
MRTSRPASNLKMPSNAIKVHEGIIFDIYQWDQEQFDGTTRKFEKAKRKVDSINVIPITKEGKVILTKQSQPGLKEFIGCLGGRAEIGENPLDAGIREMYEESGIKAKHFELLFSMQPIEKVDWAVFNFIAKDLEFTQHDNDEKFGEKIELLEFSYDEFLDLIIKDQLRDTELGYWILQHEMDQTKKENLRKIFAPY